LINCATASDYVLLIVLVKWQIMNGLAEDIGY